MTERRDIVAGIRREERSRISAALHDDALQRLYALGQDVAELVPTLGPSTTAGLVADVDGVRTALRTAVAALDERALDEAGLSLAVQRIAQDVARRGRLDVSVHVDSTTSGVHDLVLREWVRELLENVVKHAHATLCDVVVGTDGGDVVVTVTDDGSGTDAARIEQATMAGHVGLARIARRSEGLGGGLRAQRSATGGTRVEVRARRGLLESDGETERLLGTERRWSGALLSALQDALVVVRDGVVSHVNDAFCSLLGCGRDEVVDRPLHDSSWWFPDDPERGRDLLVRAASPAGVAAAFDLPRCRRAAVPVHARLQPFDDPTSGTTGVVMTLRDLTEHLAAEDRRRIEGELRTSIQTARMLTGLHHAAHEGTTAVFVRLERVLQEHLGWKHVVLNLREPAGFRVVWDPGGTLLGERYSVEEFAPFLDARFWRSGCWHIPEERSPATDGLATRFGADPEAGGAESERPGDMLLVPLRDATGDVMAVLSVDGAADGKRPRDTTLEGLAAVADHAAQALLVAGLLRRVSPRSGAPADGPRSGPPEANAMGPDVIP